MSRLAKVGSQRYYLLGSLLVHDDIQATKYLDNILNKHLLSRLKHHNTILVTPSKLLVKIPQGTIKSRGQDNLLPFCRAVERSLERQEYLRRTRCALHKELDLLLTRVVPLPNFVNLIANDFLKLAHQ